MEMLRSRFDQRLTRLVQDINLQRLCRISAERLASSALPNIGHVELGSAEAFDNSYKPLYMSMFHGGERERPDLISERLQQQFAGQRAGKPSYRFLGLRDNDGHAIAGAHFANIPLQPSDGPAFAVPYLHYIYVRAQNRRQDLSEVLHTLILAVATADGAATSAAVPFTLFETEPPGHGAEQRARAVATERTTIHTRSGARALMLRSRADGRLVSAHVQPGLELGDEPMTLTWVIRPSPLVVDYDSSAMGRAIVAAYYRSFEDEGFPEANVALAEAMACRRSENADFCEIPLAEITPEMYRNL